MSGEIVAVHGGAGRLRRSLLDTRQQLERGLREALSAGLEELGSGSALDAVEAAVKSMEASGVFNAGKGAALNALGQVELDASIMFGRDLSLGSVAAQRYTWNAVSLARKVMELTDHVLIVGAGADELAMKLGFEKHPGPSQRAKEIYAEMLESARRGEYALWRKNAEVLRMLAGDTVGAVALDKEGNLAAATSTGGIYLKLPGRVGDTPLPGAGVYAENGVVAVSATGVGEYIARYLAAARVAELVRRGTPLREAVVTVVKGMTEFFGLVNTVGLISLSSTGEYGEATNCEVFLRGLARRGEPPRVAVLAEESVT
ncbi:MAG: isoaspartyl peptidase/L-asparaginase [Thermofilum sp.]|uniref:Plant-type L-asparaginase n=1 Tax=Thermofilum pendens TaxID=2269 RepID=A0A7C4D4S3_THEPE